MRTLMRTFFLLTSLLAAGVASAAAPAVSKVVVFSDRAEVTRQGRGACKAGTADVAFPGLPVGLDERTLRAEAAGKAEALGVTNRVVPLEEDRDERVQKLMDEIEKVDLQLREIADSLASLREREATLTGYGNYFLDVWSEQVRGPRPDARRWTSVLDTLRADRMKVMEETAKLGVEQRERLRERNLLQRRLNHYARTAVAEARDARVAVDCNGLGSVVVDLSYVVPGATWHPEYDLRFVPSGSAKVGKGQAELTVAAVIQQATGEDWEEATLVLSTAKPRLGSEAPKPAQLWVDGYEVGKEKVLVQATEKRDKLAVGGEVAGGGPASAELDDRGQSVVLQLPRKETVHADGRPYWFPVDVIRGPAEAVLVSVPKLSPWVYQVVKLKNFAPYPLLPGKVHVHRRGAYVGDTALEYRGVGEPMEVSLGIDEELRIERIDLVEKNRRAGFLSNTKHMDRAYRVELENRAKQATSVEVRERIPVSKVEDVRVELNREKSSKGLELDDHRGFVTWTVKLAAGGESAVELHYAIHLPESWQVQ